ncbi:translocation/assembly module TamB domain-containing protein [Deinococcus navajonensis]|uniref:Translocation/assembly module TamB domain-containing protein n=1 Tax=Deinococcus navajonensis TaxID=309884 RepID=A0ABV8XM51_9DEIO
MSDDAAARPEPPQPGAPRPEGEVPASTPRRRPIWPWLLVAVLLGLLAYSPTLFGGLLLNRLAGDAGIRAEGVRGPLWSPSLRGARITLPGVSAQAAEAGVSVASVDPGSRTVRLNVAVRDGTVNLNLKELLSGQAGGAGSDGWKVVLSGVDVRNTRLNVNGQGVNVPNGSFRATAGNNGALAIRGRTTEGALNADVRVLERGGANSYQVDLDADARVLNHYWPGVTAGRITGRYLLGDGPIQGDLNLRDGALRVPQAAFVTVRNIEGHATHRGDRIALNLAGRGWDGPVTATGGVDLKAENWTVSANAAPKVAGLAKALGTVGEGQMDLRVTAGGWSTVRVKAYAKAAGSFARVPFQDARAEYTYLSRDGEHSGETNDLALSATTALAGQQKLAARWALGREGRASWVGDFGSKPLDVRADIDAQNVLALSGAALGGPLSGTLALQGTEIDAVLNPDYGEASARVALSGTPENLRALISGGQAGPFPLAGELRYNERGLKADLGPVTLNLNRELAGTWQARNLQGLGATLNGEGRVNLSSGDVTGQLLAQVPGLKDRLSGPINVNYVRQRGTYRAGPQRLVWNEKVFGVTLRALRLSSGVRVSGDLNVTNDLRAYGTLRAQGEGFDVRAVGQGRAASLRGTAGGVTVLADTELQAPYRTTARIQGADIQGSLTVGRAVTFRLVTAGDTARGALEGDRLSATGRVNLDALRPLLRSAGLTDPGLSGTLDLNLAGTGGSARLNARAQGAAVGGVLLRNGGVLDARLNLRAPGNVQAQLSGQVYPDVRTAGTVRAQGQILQARVSGPYNALRAQVTGRTSAITLGGVALPAQAVNLRASLTPDLRVNGTWGALQATYEGNTGLLRLTGTQTTGDVRVSGDLRVNRNLQAFGTLRAQTPGVDVRAVGRGRTASLRGAVNGLTVLADTELRAPFRTAARLQGTDIRGTLSVDRGLKVALVTRGETARVSLDGDRLTATGRIDLATLRPLVGQADLSGTLDLNFAGLGGGAAVNARVAGAQVTGTLTRAGGPLTASLRVRASEGLEAQLSGQVYPDVRTAGTVRAQGQTLQARVSGPYNALRAQVTGRTSAITLGGVALPAQAVNLRASLTPDLRVNGTWGALQATYEGNTGLLRLTGTQPLRALGRSGQVQGSATWGPGFRGRVAARGILEGYTVTLAGPWQTLRVQASSREGLRASGTASLPAGRYDLRVRGPLVSGLSVDGRVRGQGAEPQGTLQVFDAGGGSARITLRSLSTFDLTTAGLNIGGQQIQGAFQARSGQLRGTLRAGPLTLVAQGGRLRASGEFAGHQVLATGRLTLPSRVSDMNVQVNGPYFLARATGNLDSLRGTLRLNAQALGGAPARLAVPAQVFPLSASVTDLRATVGGLTYAGSTWSGSQGVRYVLNGQSGVARLSGRGQVLAAQASGPAAGRLTLLPQLGGTLSTSLSPLVAYVPEAVRPQLVPGRLVAQVQASGADLQTTGTRYQGQPLTLAARLGWQRGLTLAGALTHPGSRVPVRYDGRTLTIRGASLDARTLRPLLADAQGRLTLDLDLPGLDPARASGQALVDVQTGDQRAAGRLRLSRGQLTADLTSTLGGVAVRLTGPLYPQANAVLTTGDLRGTLTGRADETLNLRAAGTLEGRGLSLTASARGLTGSRAQVDLNGSLAGTVISLLARQEGDGLTGWRTSGSLNVPDLKALTGVKGHLRATLSGTLANLRLSSSGVAAGVAFTAPATFQGGTLRVSGAALTSGGVQARVSGRVFPVLDLSAKATLNDYLPGAYTAQVRGRLNKPDATVQGLLTNARSGLQAQGSRITARVLGQDWKADFAGTPLSGTLRGMLGTNAAGGLQTARLSVHAPFRNDQTNVRLDGTTGWNTLTGWSGALRAVGDLPGGPLDAVLDGRGTLNVAARIGSGTRTAQVTGSLGAGLPLRPAGSLRLQAFDVGALWGRGDQLRLTGTATLAGRNWAAPEAAFAGRVQDRAGELSGDLGATYRAGDVSLRLAGPQVSGGATLRAGRYEATLRAGTVTLARLLPVTLDLDALTFSGSLEVRGTLGQRPDRLALRNIALRGQQQEAGPFSLYGSATYTPQTLETALSGSLRGGVLSADGQLPQGVQVTMRDLPTAYVGAASLGRGTLGARLTLRGAATDPRVSGTVQASTDQLDALLTVSGRVRDPLAQARVSFKQGLNGTLYAEATDLDLARGTLRTHLYGTVRQGQSQVMVELRGLWPQLGGTVTAQVEGVDSPITLRGDAQGGYDLQAGPLGRGRLRLGAGQGFVPPVSGSLSLTPLPLVDGTGQLTVNATLGGTLAAPTVAASVASREAAAFGVQLVDTTGTLDGTLIGLRGSLSQAGRVVVTLAGQAVTLSDLRLSAAGSTLSASGTADLSGRAELTVGSSGLLDGSVALTTGAEALNVRGSLSGPQGLRAALDLRADPRTGWHGSARLTGGPAGVLTRPAQLTVGGAFAHPLVQGDAGLLGAGARIVASARSVQVRLVDGPGATANGVVEVRPDPAGQWRWTGAASLSRPELSLNVTPSGPLADPDVLLSVRRGDWRASGTASLRGADLSVTDGERSGSLTWQDNRIAANLPGLNLARLGIGEVGGTLTAQGQVSTATQDGQVTLRVAALNTPFTLPYLGVDLDGELSASVTLRAGRPAVQGTVTLPAGTLNVTAEQGAEHWTGRASGRLTREGGTLAVDLNASQAGLGGTLDASRFPLDVAGQDLRADGRVTLRGQTFEAALVARNTIDGDLAGQVRIDASGGLAELLPGLQGALALRPTGEGYGVNATLSDLEIADLKIAPALSGRISGAANLREGGGTFTLISDALKLGPRTLPARLEGTQVDGDWRIRGFLGQSEFTAGLTAGEVFGQGNLRALPLGAAVGATLGTTPGEGVVTGLVRFRFPLADPLAGSATVVAERIRVSATSGEGRAAVTETLTGSGTLDYARREIRNVNVQLSGAGTWDVRGQYTRELVDLRAQFTNTTFTPVLQLIPGLAELDPSLKGTLTLSAAGTYDRPRGVLRAQNLAGAVAGLSLQVPAFAGDLPDSGAFTGSGRILTGGTVGADLNVALRGQLTLGDLSGTVVTASGLLAPEALGALPNSSLTLTQSGDRWTLEAQSRSSGAAGAGLLQLSGTVAPQWDLSLTARNYNLPLAVIYGRESVLNADLRAVDDGDLVRVTGSADFVRLILGRVNAPDVIPAPGRSTPGNESGRTTDNYDSPLPPEFTTFPRPAGEEGADRPTLPFLERLVFGDIPIRAPNGIRVDENLARAEFTGNLVLSGTGARPLIRGDIVAQRGSLFLRENEFSITQSTVTFSGQSLYPSFSLSARGTVLAVTTRQRVPVLLSVNGDFVTRPDGTTGLELDTVLSCAEALGTCTDPDTGLAYTEAELYALVATGVPNLTALPDNIGSLGASALQTALNVFVLGELERSIAKAFGLDVFRFTPQLLNADGSVGATFTVGSYLTRDLYLQYQVNLNGEGLIDATYNTPDNRFTFRVSTPLNGLNLQSIRPSFSAAYNINPRTSVSIGVENTERNTRLRFGVTYRIGGR